MSQTAIANFTDRLRSRGIKVVDDLMGSTLCTYRVGGAIAHCVYIKSYSEVEMISDEISNNYSDVLKNKVVTIGNGSNLLITDEGFDGCAIIFEDELANTIKFDVERDSIIVSAGSGTALPLLARQCVPKSCGGLEFYVGIPGTVGGAVAMNAGGHGCQTSDVFKSCDVISVASGEIKTLTKQDCNFGYRQSCITNNDVVISAQFIGKHGDQEQIKEEIDSIVSWRRDNQPGGRNVGSVFQNTQKYSAGELIEKCGLKGKRIGKAFVSQKHANFIQAEQGAKASDIKYLIDFVQENVYEQTGEMLETEVRFIGNNYA